MRKFTFFATLVAVMISFNGWGQTVVNFDDAAKWTAGSVAVTSYANNHTYVDGVFSSTGGPALRNTNATQDGFPGALGTYSWRLRDVNTVDFVMTIASGGVGSFSVKIRRWDGSPSPDFNLEYATDGGTLWTLVSVINNTTLNNSSDWTLFSGTINSSNSNIKIRLKANGTTERIMIDDFSWFNYAGTATPTQVAVTLINGGSSPLAGTPFDVVVQAQDGSGSAAAVTSNTNIALSLVTGTGTLGGTLTGIILSGSSVGTVSGVTYSPHENGVVIKAAASGLTAVNSAAFNVLFVPQSYRSKTNGNWNDATTWQAYDGSTWFDAYDWPTDATKDVTIRTGHTVVNPAGYYNAKANNLTIETGAKLWANSTSGASFVYVYGDFTNNGTVGGTDDVIGFDIEGASCTLSGSGTFTASRINKYTTASTTTNLFINQDVTLHYAHASNSALYNNGSGDMLNIIVGAGKYLNVPNATVNLNDATLTLENGAMFLENGVLPNNSLTNFSLKRDISGNVYHLLASPVETTTIGSVFPSAQHNNIWIRSYTETTGNWTNLDAAGSFVNGYGYSITMDVASTTATFTGILKLSDATPVLTNSGTSTNAEYDGWNLIGNPFAAPLDWNHGSWAKTNIDNTVYTWSAGIGNYVSWNGTAGGLTNGIIPVAQGFFVKANAASPSINIPPTARVLNTQAYYKNTVSELLSLKVSGTANAYSDETFINYNTQASPLFDNAFDAFHLDGLEDAPQLWTLADQKYAINVMKSVAESPEVNMAFKAGVNDEFTITASGMESFNGNEPIWLNDFATGTRQDLRQNASYTFTAKPGDDENRFKITFAGVGVDNPEQAAIRMYTQPGTIFINLPALTKAQMNIYNLNGQIVYRQAVHASGLMSVPHKLTTGTYIIQLISEQQTVNQKLFIQ